MGNLQLKSSSSMKQLFILICLLISTSTFSQITTDSVFSVSSITQIQQDSIIQTATSTSIMTTKLDLEQIARINNIEKKLKFILHLQSSIPSSIICKCGINDYRRN